MEDWLPTLLALTGAEEGAGDGVNLAPVLLHGETRDRAFLYREFAGYGGHQAVWIGKFKGIRPRLEDGDTTIELYDLESDESESHDVSDQHPEVIAQIEAIMEREHVPSELFPLKGLDSE